MLVGGVAGGLYGAVRPTQDVDLLVNRDPANLDRVGVALTAAQPTCPSQARIAATLNQLDGEGAVVEALGSGEDGFTLVEATRRATTMTYLASPRPHTVRQGYSVEFITRIAPIQGGYFPSGSVSVFVDGEPVGVRAVNTPFDQGYSETLPVQGATMQGIFLLPPDFPAGTHLVSVRYSGDLILGPSEANSTFTVLESAGHPFICRSPAAIGTARYEWGANVTFDADVPTMATAGETVDLDVSSAQIRMNRQFSANPMPSFANADTTPVDPNGPLKGISFGLGGIGEGSAVSLERQGGTPMASTPTPAPPEQVDQTLTLHDPTASVTIEGEPGEVVPVELDQIVVSFALLGTIPAPSNVTCVPADEDDPMVLGEVAIAGTTVTATPERAREITDEVTIEASTFPSDAAGTVSFSSSLDGNLGSDPVSGGVAELSTDELSPGTHVITASFNATDPDVPDTSGTVTVVVQYSPRTGTQAFVVAARTDYTGEADEDEVLADAAALSGGQSRTAYLNELSRSDAYLTHVVNGMYVDTLGREGDAAGVEFWIGRLRAGWTVARVAASFYSSSEYYQRVGGTDQAWVGDLYDVLLGRAPDTAGQDFWVARVATHGRDQVALSFFQTPESARARVTALYDQFLGRAPSAADRDFWANRVIARGDLILAVELTLSAEYDQRARTRYPLV